MIRAYKDKTKFAGRLNHGSFLSQNESSLEAILKKKELFSTPAISFLLVRVSIHMNHITTNNKTDFIDIS